MPHQAESTEGSTTGEGKVIIFKSLNEPRRLQARTPASETRHLSAFTARCRKRTDASNERAARCNLRSRARISMLRSHRSGIGAALCENRRNYEDTPK